MSFSQASAYHVYECLVLLKNLLLFYSMNKDMDTSLNI
jgi:hypothetical protein